MSTYDSVLFKIFIDDGKNDESEVRRFGIENDVATNFSYFSEKLKTVFPSLTSANTDDLYIYWKDPENDKVRISSDNELIMALTQMEQEVKKLYIKIIPSENEGDVSDNEQENHNVLVNEEENNEWPILHEGIICDGCEGPVLGFRYKCLQCPSFDLCSTCEATGAHPEHYMLRMSAKSSIGLKVKTFDDGEKRKWHFNHKMHRHHKGPVMGPHYHHHGHGFHKGAKMGPGFPHGHHQHGHHKGQMMNSSFSKNHHGHCKGAMIGSRFVPDHHEHGHNKEAMMGSGFPQIRFCPYSKKFGKKQMKHLKKHFKKML